MAYKPGKFSDVVSYEKEKTAKLKAQDEKNIARNEKQYAGELHLEGRKAYFRERFEGIELKEQQLPQIGPFENIAETYHFMEGYKKGPFLVEIGAIPEEYQQIDVQKKHR